MALPKSRTKFVIVLIVNYIGQIATQSDILQPSKYIYDDIKGVSLLRGSGEDKNDLHGETVLETAENVYNESDKVLTNRNILEDIDATIKDHNDEQIHGEGIERNAETTTNIPELQTTMIAEEIPEALSLRDNDKDDAKSNEDFEEINTGDDIVITTSPVETTEADTARTFSIENDSNSKDNETDDNIMNSSENILEMDKAEPTKPTLVTTVMMEPEESERNEAEPVLNTSGLRNPKTEEGETQSHNFQNDETKPRLAPGATKLSTLKLWLEDPWLRAPAGILVPLRASALSRTRSIWQHLTASGLNISDIVVVGYDHHGINWRSRHNLQPSTPENTVTDALSKLLAKYQGVNSENSDGTIKALALAAKLVPYDSAVFLFTDKAPGDHDRLALALRALIEKRLKVYTIWTDPNYNTLESQVAVSDLKNISDRTEGDLLPYTIQEMELESTNMALEAELHQWDPNTVAQSRTARLNSQVDADIYDTLIIRSGGGDAISLGVPVENGVSALKIYIEGDVEHAVLYPPNDGPQIDLYNTTSVRSFSTTSRTENQSPREVYLIFPNAESHTNMLSVVPMTVGYQDAPPSPLVGIWHISVRCDACNYKIIAAVRSSIHFNAELSSKSLKLRITGPVASVRETYLVDDYGNELAKLPFSSQPMVENDEIVQEHGDTNDFEAEVPMPAVDAVNVYAKINGRDIKGDPFIRLSGPLNHHERTGRSANIVFPDSANDLERTEEMNLRAYSNLQLSNVNTSRISTQQFNQQGQVMTAVQIGLSSKLYGAPTERFQIHFEVTNYRDSSSVRLKFGATGEQRFLTGISPSTQTINAGQTVNVIISLYIPSGTVSGTRDYITFTAYDYYSNAEQVSMSAYVYVTDSTTPITDVWAPTLRYYFQGSCIGRLGNDCAQHVWSVTVVSRDDTAGLLRLSSTPVGITYTSNFVAGTREEVTALYRATCCAPRVSVTALDAYGNANSYTIDISNYFTESAIAAIVLGVLLIIALIGLIIFLIYLCVKRRKESADLPSYSTRNISSRNTS